MPFSHRYFTINHHIIGIVDDPVNDCIGNGAVIVWIGIDTVIPALSLILGTENHRSLNAGFNYFKQIIALMGSQFSDQLFIKYQQINLLVILDNLADFSVCSCDAKLVEQFRHTDITN